MSSSLPEIRENEAPPEIAAVYDEIRRASGLPLVNLIYRHLATLPGALPWVWGLVRGPILAGAAEPALNRVAAALHVPTLDPEASRAAGLAPPDVEAIGAVLDVYHRGNLLNLICLTAVLAVLDRPRRSTGSAAAAPGTRLEGPAALRQPIPPLPKLTDLPAETAALVRSLAGLHGAASTAGAVPSLYLHLAPWPGFLAAMRDPLAHLVADGSLERARSNVRRLAQAEAAALALTMATDRPVPPDQVRVPMRQALDTFTRRLIPEMIPVGLVLRSALPGQDG